MPAPSTFVIGPSHVHASIMSENDRRLCYGNDVKIEAHCGLPVWSSRILPALREHAEKGMRVVWIVSDWKFNNRDYDVIKRDDAPLFLDTLGHANNVDNRYMSKEHIEVLTRHAMRCIDHVVKALPQVRLVFWCLYKRTRAYGSSSSYPGFAWYEETIRRYRDNVIDVDDHTTPHAFNACLVRDEGGHPSSAGQKVLAGMIMGVSPP